MKNPNNSGSNPKYNRRSVVFRKNKALKDKLETLIKASGLTNYEFYKKVEIPRQEWYHISWGLKEPPLAKKIRIAKVLGVDSAVIWN